MSSRFDRAYRVSGTTVVNADLWNRIMRDLDTRIVAVEEKKADFEEAEKTLLELALRRINETLLPAAQRIQAVSELGFLIASSDEELTVVPDQQASLRISEGAQRDLFTPSPFVALTRRSTVEDYAIARVVTYNRDTGILVVHIESVTGNPGPHNDWDVVALAGAVMAQMATLDETKALRSEVANDKAAVALDKAAAQSARTEAQAARDAAIIAKTDAENALASFMTVYRGALPSAPPDGEQGHFYFDTTLQMALVYTATGWAPLFQVAIGGIRQGFVTATADQTEIDVGGDFTFINVWKNGALLTAGVDYTTASPKIILTTPAASGDEIAYTGYHSTDASDFYTKMAADNRFTRKDNTGTERMDGLLEVRRLISVKARETGNVDIVLLNNAGEEVASIYATPSTRYFALRRNNGDGTFETLAFLQGQLVYNGNTIYHAGNADSRFVRLDGAQGLTAAQQSQARANIDAGILAGFRNKLINGNFDVWQRGTSQSGLGFGSVDRWRLNGLAPSGALLASRREFDLGQTAVPGNPRYYLRIAGSSFSSTELNLGQTIEDVRTLAGRKATLTFWARASAPRQLRPLLVQEFGTGGSPSSPVQTFGDPVNLTTSWQRFSQVFDVPSIAGKVLGTDGNDFLTVALDVKRGAFGTDLGNGYIDIAHVSLVEGDATAEYDPFSPRHIQQELALCQRYYVRMSDIALNFNAHVADGHGSWWISFPTTMRAAPTLGSRFVDGDYSGLNSLSWDNPTRYGARLLAKANAASDNKYFIMSGGDYIEASAEL